MGLMNASGIKMLNIQRAALHAKLCKLAGNKASIREFSTSLNEDRMADFAAEMQEEAVPVSQLAAIVNLLAVTQPAPAPTSSKTIQLGNLVTLSCERPKRKVEEFTILLGGEHEPDSYENVKTISTASPLGKGLLGKHVGADIEIQTPHGLMNYEVLAIKIPDPTTPIRQLAA